MAFLTSTLTSGSIDSTPHELLAQELKSSLSKHSYLKQVNVVVKPGQLDARIQAHILQNGLDPSAVQGVFVGGQAYVIASNLPSIDDGITTALHEMVGHVGVRGLLLERFEPVMHQVYRSFPRQHDAWVNTARRYGYLDTGTEAGQIAFAEELTAYMAEEDVDLGEFDMIKAEIRSALREFFPELPVTEVEVRALVQRSRESLILRHGNPLEIADVRERMERRAKAVAILQSSMLRRGLAVPDALSLEIYRQGGRVVDTDGVPCRLYHGAGASLTEVKGVLWGSVDPKHANEYAELRAMQGQPSLVIPFYADIQRPFDGDRLSNVPATYETPDGLSVYVFVEEVIRQSQPDADTAEWIRAQGKTLRQMARREESGPSYDPQHFWYMNHWTFGRDGKALIDDIFYRAGFDGIRFTENGQLTYGAFHSGQVHFIDQGASPRGWLPTKKASPNVNYGSMETDVRLSFAGQRAESADHLALATAKARLAEGDDAEQVRQDTGWFMGADGFWRFEINDADAQLQEGIASLSEDSTWEDAYAPAYRRSLLERGHGLRLSDVVVHPRLFAAYPALANLIISDIPDGPRAQLFNGDGTEPAAVYVLRSLPLGEVVSSVLHEIQHRIQFLEGFAQGGSVRQAPRFIAAHQEAAVRDRATLEQLMDSARSKARDLLALSPHTELVQNTLHDWRALVGEQGEDNKYGLTQERAVQLALIADDSMYQALAQRQRSSERLANLTPIALYERLYGEIEARNVQTRQRLSDEERRLLSPQETQDIHDLDAIVLINGIARWKAPTPANSYGQAEQPRLPDTENLLPNQESIRFSIAGVKASNDQAVAAAFNDWFGASRVVDPHGHALVVYKGMYPYDWRTGETITSIDRQEPFPAFYPGENGINIAGFFGTAEVASHFAQLGFSGAVFPVYLSLQRPYEVDAEGQLAGNMQFGETGRAFREAMRSGEYDGAILYNTSDEGTIYITTRADQAKSIFNAGTFDPTHPDMRFCFAGESARTADRMTLDYAKLALSAGMEPALIHQITGWSQGVDGRWRFEINDALADIAFGEASSSNPEAYIDWIEEASSRERGVNLSQVLLHSALYEAYPLLKTYRLIVASPSELGQGDAAVDRDNRLVKIKDPMQMAIGKSVLSILLHEVQHCVQDIEDFAQGGLPADVGHVLDADAFESISDRHDELLASSAAQEILQCLETLRNQWQGRPDIPPAVVEEVQQLQGSSISKTLNGLQRQAARLVKNRQFGGTNYSREELFEGYQRLAGEVESRNVQARAHFTDDQRRKHLPEMTEDKARSDQLIVDRQGGYVLAPVAPDAPSLMRADEKQGRVFNSTQSGTNLQDAAIEMLDVLEPFGLATGWMDGGCRCFAEALHVWSKGRIEIGVTSRDGKQASHAVGVLALPGAERHCLLIDADGIARSDELIHKLEALEFSPGEKIVAIGAQSRPWVNMLPGEPDLIQRTSTLLNLMAGPYAEWESTVLSELHTRWPDYYAAATLEREDHATLTPARPFEATANYPRL